MILVVKQLLSLVFLFSKCSPTFYSMQEAQPPLNLPCKVLSSRQPRKYIFQALVRDAPSTEP